MYVAGPLSGPADQLAESYRIAFDALRRKGADVIGPAHTADGRPSIAPAELLDCVADDVDNVLAADAVVVMPGTGAWCPDVTIAQSFGIPVVDLADVVPAAAKRIRWLRSAAVAVAAVLALTSGWCTVGKSHAPPNRPADDRPAVTLAA